MIQWNNDTAKQYNETIIQQNNDNKTVQIATVDKLTKKKATKQKKKQYNETAEHWLLYNCFAIMKQWKN